MISAALVKELREITGVGMMDCKKALEDANGDLNIAINLMRESGKAKVLKKINRTATEGIVLVKTDKDNKKAIMLEINCETDFVSRDLAFLDFANYIADQSLVQNIIDLENLMSLILPNGKTVIEERDLLIGKIGEKIDIRRIFLMSINDGMIANYVHNNHIGVLVGLSVSNTQLGKDIAMHIAACDPIALTEKEIPIDILEKEKITYINQLKNINKSPDISAKIIEGKLQKYIGEITLLKQQFIKNQDITITDLLKNFKANIFEYVRFEVGKGLKKEEE